AGGKVQQPGGDHAAAPPDFGDVRQIELELIVLRVTQGRRLGVSLALSSAGISRFQNTHALRIGGHDAVFNAVVDHFDEVTSPIRTAMQITLFGRAVEFFAAGSAWNTADARRQGSENGIQVLNHLEFAADHHAIAAFQAPHPAAGAYVNVMNSL